MNSIFFISVSFREKEAQVGKDSLSSRLFGQSQIDVAKTWSSKWRSIVNQIKKRISFVLFLLSRKVRSKEIWHTLSGSYTRVCASCAICNFSSISRLIKPTREVHLLCILQEKSGEPKLIMIPLVVFVVSDDNTGKAAFGSRPGFWAEGRGALLTVEAMCWAHVISDNKCLYWHN